MSLRLHHEPEVALVMKTSIEFRSGKFPPYEGEEEQINPGLWGKRLAEYIVEKLAASNVVTQEIYSEDWGWAIPIENRDFPLWVACGHMSVDDDDAFLCSIMPDKPVIRRWFRKIDTQKDVGRVADALEKILSADPDIRDIHWRADEED
jgi:hypothetical protein